MPETTATMTGTTLNRAPASYKKNSMKDLVLNESVEVTTPSETKDHAFLALNNSSIT